MLFARDEVSASLDISFCVITCKTVRQYERIEQELVSQMTRFPFEFSMGYFA
jgi:hypothetical protein